VLLDNEDEDENDDECESGEKLTNRVFVLALLLVLDNNSCLMAHWCHQTTVHRR
jgi:hypothetical protein